MALLTMLLTAHGFCAHLRAAFAKSDAFDRALGLEVSVLKCAVVAAVGSQEAQHLAPVLGYKHKQSLETLEIFVPFQGGWGLLKFSLRRVVLRLRLLRGVGLGNVAARKLIRSLVLPCFAWAAAYAAPHEEDLAAVSNEVEYYFDTHTGQGVATVLFYKVAGWFLEPQFSLDVAACAVPGGLPWLPRTELRCSPSLSCGGTFFKSCLR